MKVIVLIADIVDSRNIEDRSRFQALLEETLGKVNRTSRAVLSPHTITLGDEFQAVYESGEGLFRDIFTVLTVVYPVGIRFAVAYDEIVTPINKIEAIGMDGPAFHKARHGLERMKKERRTVIQIFSDDILRVPLINQSLLVMKRAMENWKYNTYFIFNELLKKSTIRDMAEKLGISERGVYKITKTNGLKEFAGLCEAIEDEIKRAIASRGRL